MPPEAQSTSIQQVATQVGGGTLISELTDSQGWFGYPPEYIDIRRATISQDAGFLTFAIETDGPILTSLPVDGDHLMFLWLVDTDLDSSTGQAHGGVGSEFNVRAMVEPGALNGFVDVTGATTGGGTGEVSVVDNRIEIVVGMGQIGSPAQFNWRANACGRVNGTGVGCNDETTIASATTLPYVAPASVELVAPLLMLSPAGLASGQLEVVLRDEVGNLLDPLDFTLQFSSGNEAVATVDANGLVAVHSTPVDFWDTPYLSATADGVPSGNNSVVRSTTSDLGIAHQYYDGEFVSYYLPATLEGINLDAITTSFEVVAATDLAYQAQQLALNTAPFGGERQYLVLDVSDDGNTTPCGLSGNPVRLGWQVGLSNRPNCYICESCWAYHPGFGTQPRHFIFYHEIGHNFTFASASMGQFMTAYGPMQGTYVEGLASLAAMWSWFMIDSCSPGLSTFARDSVREGFEVNRFFWDRSLDDYLAAGANYDNLGAGELDAILFELFDEFGPKLWYDFFSTFTPSDQPLPVALDTREKQATWLVAAFSASTGQDLRSRFADDYGFPIDNVAWSSILAAVQERIDARNYADLDADLDGVLNACDACVAPAAPVSANVATNRYLAFHDVNPGESVALRVRFVDLPPPHDVLNGHTMWVGPPRQVSELGGVDDATPPTFTAATLQCEPGFETWSAEGPVYVYYEAIVPGGIYEVQAIRSNCDVGVEMDYSVALTVGSSVWGDAVGPFDSDAQQWMAADGSVDVATDVVAVLDKFGSLPGSPTKTRADLEPGLPDQKINITDATFALDAFGGAAYPFPVPETCP